MPRLSLSGWRAATVLGIAVLQLAFVLGTFDRAPVDHVSDAPGASQTEPTPPDIAAQMLPGSWLREHSADGVQSHRLLHLESGGGFTEHVRIVDASGAVTQQEHAGSWFFDGINLKRKYTLMDGRAPSRLRLPFATFEIRFESRNEFVGIDHIHQNTVRYRRVPLGTQL